jgi:integrase
MRNTTDDAAVPAKVRSTTPSRTVEQVTTFLGCVQGKLLYPAFLTLATTGLRRSELLGLRWADVDLEAGTLAVRQVVSLDRYKPFLAEPKTSRSRRVTALDPGTVRTFKSHPKVQNEGRLLAGKRGRIIIWCSLLQTASSSILRRYRRPSNGPLRQPGSPPSASTAFATPRPLWAWPRGSP